MKGVTVERPTGGLAARAEDILRLIAGAASAVRLYPPASPLREQAIGRFVDDAASATAANGPLQYRIDRGRFLFGDGALGETLPQVSALAESLHALQVGQLIIAPGINAGEVTRFLDLLGGDSKAIRGSGGFRAALQAAGVEHLAVIEVTLRATTEEGLLGLDLATAPLEEIAPELAHAADSWRAALTGDGPAPDEVAAAIDRLEPATRNLALDRCAEAMLLLDEETRVQMLSAALSSDATGSRMDGMLATIAHMSPAALARLLKLAAAAAGREADALLDAIEFPPELAAELATLLRPAPQSEKERGVPAEADADGIVAEVAASDDHDLARIRSLVRMATPRDAAARGLTMTTRLLEEQRTPDAVRTLGAALGPAIHAGAFGEIMLTMNVFQELARDPQLAPEIEAVRRTLADPEVLLECADTLARDPDATGPRALLEAAGTAGADALLRTYVDGSDVQRANLLPTASAMPEPIAASAGRMLKSADGQAAAAVVRLLGSMRMRRLLPTIALALDNLDDRAREAAMAAITESPGPECAQLLGSALTHWDPETRRLAAREIGRVGAHEAVPALIKVLTSNRYFDSDYELKKEALRSIEALHSQEALPAVRRISRQTVNVSKKRRELKYLAERVRASLERG